MEIEAKAPETAGLYSLMNEEIKLNVHVLNGENWAQLGDKRVVFRNYESSISLKTSNGFYKKKI